jgi:hypothetical protein
LTASLPLPGAPHEKGCRGDCDQVRLLHLTDPDAPSEAEFEHSAARALACFYPDYDCIVFSGSFRLDDEIYRPDLALVAKNYAHWFVIEVELASHSFSRHVLPQVRAFRYGQPLDDVPDQLARELKITTAKARTLTHMVPRTVAVVANKRIGTWEIELRSHDIILLTVSSFRSPGGVDALELDGDLLPPIENLGFRVYSATDRSMRFPATVRLPERVQIHDLEGAPGIWAVTRDSTHAWVTKETGTPSIPHGSFVQLLRTVDGKITLRRPTTV